MAGRETSDKKYVVKLRSRKGAHKLEASWTPRSMPTLRNAAPLVPRLGRASLPSSIVGTYALDRIYGDHRF